MKKFWKIVKWLIITVVIIIMVEAGTLLFFSRYRPTIEKADAIVVLGAAINTPSLYNRSLEGLRLYEQGKAPVMVLSGGVDYPRSIPEAVYMQKVILQNTSSTPALILDPDSRSTFENLKNTQNLIGQGKSIIIVSDSFHIARAVLTAMRLGFHPIYWDSPNPGYYSLPELAYYYGREMLAMVDYLPKLVMGK